MQRPQTSIEGALYDLVARGKKDTYFLRDDANSVNLFDTRYDYIPASIPELRIIVPKNRVQWGNVVEFEIEKAGDILIEPTLSIILPSWLPPPYDKLNQTNLITDTTSNSNAYGYVNGVAYVMFEKIQFYQDTLLLQEYSGDSLFALRHIRGSYNSSFLEDALTGVRDTASPLAVQRAAIPGQLRLRIHLPLCQHVDEGGLPLCATENQQFRLRLTLRKLEDLIEMAATASNAPTTPSVTKPSPFGLPFVLTDITGKKTTFTTLTRPSVRDPTIYLVNRQLYLDKEDAKELAYPKGADGTTAPYSRLFENNFTFGPADYAALPNSVAISKRRIDGRHPSEQAFWYFRSRADLIANRLWKFEMGSNAATASTQVTPYYKNIKFTIAGRDREDYWTSLVWQDIEAHAKLERYSGRGIGVWNWSYGERHSDRGPKEFGPTGTINFTSADRPTVYVDLAQTPDTSQTTQMTLVVDGYGVYSVRDGRGGLLFAN